MQPGIQKNRRRKKKEAHIRTAGVLDEALVLSPNRKTKQQNQRKITDNSEGDRNPSQHGSHFESRRKEWLKASVQKTRTNIHGNLDRSSPAVPGQSIGDLIIDGVR